MNKKQFSIKIFAYVKASIDDVIYTSPEGQAEWLVKTKKYVVKDKINPVCRVTRSYEEQIQWIEEIKYYAPFVAINSLYSKLYPIEYEYDPILLMNVFCDLEESLGNKIMIEPTNSIHVIMNRSHDSIDGVQIFTHFICEFAKNNSQIFNN